MNMRILLKTLLVGFTSISILAACNPSSSPMASGSEQIKVVATTTIVGDVVGVVAGDSVELTVLLPPGADPHTYEARPQDLAKVADADLIFLSGAGLEEMLEPLIVNAGGKGTIISLSDGMELLESSIEHTADEHDADHAEGDPHVWTDPNNILYWVDRIEATLLDIDPDHSELYRKNAEQYRAELIALDKWIRVEVAQIPPAKRMLVTDHLELTYFARRYGFEVIGAVIPNYSTTADTSAQELATLEDTIRGSGVTAIFIGNTANPNLAQRVATDTGIQLVSLFTGSLTEPGGEASTYLEFMRYNVQAISGALK